MSKFNKVVVLVIWATMMTSGPAWPKNPQAKPDIQPTVQASERKPPRVGAQLQHQLGIPPQASEGDYLLLTPEGNFSKNYRKLLLPEDEEEQESGR